MARTPKEGEAYIAVHADTDPFAREAELGVRRGAEQAEDDLKHTGDEWGEILSDSLGKRLEKEGPHFAKSLEKGIGSQKVNVPIKADYQRDRSATRKVAAKVIADIEDAVLEAGSGGGSGGGPFGKVGQAFADAIGAGFNVSGKSPLITFLVPVIGAIVGLVIAAIQAVNALLAVLVTLPGILAAIGLQVGVVMVAFEGMGKAVQGAFAAKNAKELKAALQGLAPAAQDFVKSLLPIKDFFYQLRFTTQQNFFKFLGDDLIPQLLKFQGNRILSGFQEAAKALGTFFHDLGFFFNSDSFTKFLDEVFPRTITFLEQFGPSFITFLGGLIDLANAAMPFMTEVGGIVSMIFKQIGDFFTATANDPEFLTWLQQMRDTLDDVVTFVKVAFVFIGQLMDSINRAGGDDVITQLSMSLALIGDFLTSDVGVKAMEAFINIAIVSIQVLTGLIIAILAIAGAAQKVGEYIKNSLLGDIGDFFVWLWGRITALWDKIVEVVNSFVDSVRRAANGGRDAITGFVNDVSTKVSNAIAAVIGFVKSVPDRVKQFFSDAGSWLIQAGRNIINGLIQGIKDMLGGLGTAMSWVAQKVSSYLPHSPAKVGPLSGEGDPMRAGQTIVNRVATGMEMEVPRLQQASATATSNITFGPNSIQMRFTGLPNDAQSQAAGSAVANGIFSTMARDTRLAVRTL